MVLVPIYGIMVPFHILTLKNATNNQDNDHSYIRLNFNFGPGYEPCTKFPSAICLKELSFRTADTRHAAKVRAEGAQNTGLVLGFGFMLSVTHARWLIPGN